MAEIIEYTSENCPPHVYMGKHSYCYGQFRGAGNKVIIGAFTSIAEGVSIDCGFNHDHRMTSTFPFKNRFPTANNVDSNVLIRGDVIIGNDVWIGERSIIMSGLLVGDGAVIGANSVVTKNIGPYEIWGGCPAKFIKMRFDINTIRKLQEIKWHLWPDEKIAENAHLLNGDIQEFIKKHYTK